MVDGVRSWLAALFAVVLAVCFAFHAATMPCHAFADDGPGSLEAAPLDSEPIAAPHEEGRVLVLLDGSATFSALAAFIDGSDILVDQQVDPDDFAFGVVELELADGATVEQAIEELSDAELFASVQPNYTYRVVDGIDEGAKTRLRASASDETGWQLEAIGMPAAWEIARCSGSVTVAVVDSGCDASHPDLVGNVLEAYSYNAIDKTADVSDGYGHGTHVAGIIAAKAENGLGIDGASYDAGIMAVKVIDDDGGTNSLTAARGLARVLETARDHPELNIKVVNMSFGGKIDSLKESDELLVSAMESAEDQGIVVVCAAGNSYAGVSVPYRMFPSDYVSTSVNVIAMGKDYARYRTSNYNLMEESGVSESSKTLSAPGELVYSTMPGGDYGSKSGTSMAAPYVSSVAALMYAADPNLSPSDVRALMCETAIDLGDPGFDAETGYGLIDAEAAVRAAYERAHPEGSDSEPEPSQQSAITGPERMPVGATAAFSASKGTLVLAEGTGIATLASDGTLTATASGTVRLAVQDETGRELGCLVVELYPLSGAWTLQSPLAESLVLDVSGASTSDGANVQVWEGNGTAAQRFSFQLDGAGFFEVRCFCSNKALDVSGGYLGNGGNVQQYRSNGTDAQRWVLSVDADGLVTLAARHSGLVLDVSGGSHENGANVQQYASNGTLAQKWRLVPVSSSDSEDGQPDRLAEGVYRISSAIDRRYVLDVAGGSRADGANVQVYAWNGTDAQRWRVIEAEDGLYRIESIVSGKALDVSGGSWADGANIQQYAWNGTDAQLWKIVPNGDGTWTLRRNGRGSVIDVAGGAATSGNNVWLYASNGTAAQRFVFTKAEG